MSATSSERQHRRLKWFWIANLPFCMALYLWAYGVAFDAKGVLILYLALVSVYANIVSHAGAEQACRATEAAQD